MDDITKLCADLAVKPTTAQPVGVPARLPVVKLFGPRAALRWLIDIEKLIVRSLRPTLGTERKAQSEAISCA